MLYNSIILLILLILLFYNLALICAMTLNSQCLFVLSVVNLYSKRNYKIV